MRAPKKVFTKEVRMLMYGFGDVSNPSPDSVDLMETMLNTYILDLCESAAAINPKPKTNDFLHALRKDPKKRARGQELLALDKDFKRARTIFNDVPEMAQK
ncbi:transcription initiation factor IID, 18kDa subunit [Phlyctochytrium arcticum]|nr:transcription initiation factor IID, 18kDa subunit [Phlyctochytrium arcticum]